MPLCSFISQLHINPNSVAQPTVNKHHWVGEGHSIAVVPSQRLVKDSATFRTLSLSFLMSHCTLARGTIWLTSQQQRLLLSSRGGLCCWKKALSLTSFSLYFPVITWVSVQYEKVRSRWYLKIYADTCSVVIVVLAQSLKRVILYLVILFFFFPQVWPCS